eukprot:TRINITY_DN9337_c0_g2_i1.p1 TRINITY_DN9337_c0_g2~~TRINITY_DN9337_c0_g2_i1.p1  ORF type:complete len:725 (+),score=256.61 TRINITY_DN9337_c0_g2_i1:42-2177(+)
MLPPLFQSGRRGPMKPAVDPIQWAAGRKARIEQARARAEERRESQSLQERLEEIARAEERVARKRGCARVDVPLHGGFGVFGHPGFAELDAEPLQRHARDDLPFGQPEILEEGHFEQTGQQLDKLQAARVAAHAERERLRQQHGGAKRVMLFGMATEDSEPAPVDAFERGAAVDAVEHGAAVEALERSSPSDLGALEPKRASRAGLQQRLEQRAARAAAEAAARDADRAAAAAALCSADAQSRGRPARERRPHVANQPPLRPTDAPHRRPAVECPRRDPEGTVGEDAKENRAPRAEKALPAKPASNAGGSKQRDNTKALAASRCVGEVAALAKAREERRARQAQQRQQREEAVAASGGDESAAVFRRMVDEYRRRLGRRHALPPPATGGDLVVSVRKRPMNQREVRHGMVDCATCTTGAELVFHEPKLRFDLTRSLDNHKFCFDRVFDAGATNDEVYDSILGPHLRRGLQGALTVFAYGQTGSGKTYTMRALCGAAVGDLIRGADDAGLAVHVSAFEIYMNKVYDLLDGRTEVRMLEDGDREMQVVGLTEHPVPTAADVEVAMAEMERVRTTSANAVHNDSSRSHAVVQLVLRSPRGRMYARLSLVDLAGSERAAETQTDGATTRLEGAEINKSLLALKECIRAAGRNADHVPYRGSLLTRALRGCFDGGSVRWQQRTIVIATVSPTLANADHSLNTLRYAARLKELRTRS